MSSYGQLITKIMQEKVAHFTAAGLVKEAQLLQAKLNSFSDKSDAVTETAPQPRAENKTLKTSAKNLKQRAENSHIPELEKQYIIEGIGNAKTLDELKPLRIAYMERLLKISRMRRGEKISATDDKTGAGPYNNEKTFNEALRLIYSQDPLWIEDLKELYFSVMPQSAAAVNKANPKL